MSRTLKDVARHANVAVMTASKVFNDVPTVRSHIRHRVLKSAKELGYSPNILAKGLRKKTSDIISLGITSIQRPFFGMLSQLISGKIRGMGFEPVLCNNMEKISEVNRNLLVAGTIIIIPGDEEAVKRFTAGCQSSVTVFAQEPEKQSVPNVGIDFSGAYGEIIDKMVEEGRKRFCYYCHYDDYDFLHKEVGGKFHTVLSHLRMYGLELVLPEQYNMMFAASFADFMQLHNFDAVLCENDLLALLLSDELRSRGVNIPQNARIVGCDGLFPLTKGLWSLRIDLEKVADQAVGLLNQALQGDFNNVENNIIQPEAIIN